MWCSKGTPAFAYVQGRSVLSKTFGGALQELFSADRLLLRNTLECSDDGNVVAVLSSDVSQLLVMVGSKLGRYTTDLSAADSIRNFGQMLSPNGAIIAAPFHLSYLSGDDVLSRMRVLNVGGDNLTWRHDELLYFDGRTVSVKSLITNTGQLSTLGRIPDKYAGRLGHIHGISACKHATLVSFAWRSGNPSGSDREIGSGILNMSPPFGAMEDTGELSFVSADGRPDSICLIAHFSMEGEYEVFRYELLYADGLVSYPAPVGLTLGNPPGYNVAISPSDCLILGTQYPTRKGQPIEGPWSVVALRITRSGRCP
jgi:hypothetical protein